MTGNLLHNLHELGPSLPIHTANNTIVDSRVVYPTFPLTTIRMVVLVLNPTYHIWNLLIIKSTTTKHTKGPKITKFGTLLVVKWSRYFTLRDKRLNLRMHTLAKLPPILNGRLEKVNLHQFFSVD